MQMVEILVNIDVDDLERGGRILHTGAGSRGWSASRNVFCCRVDGCWLAILPARTSGRNGAYAGSQTRRNYERHWTPVHLDFVVGDLNAAVRRAQAAGATLESESETHEWGRVALMADPFGHGFCLLQFIGRGYDEIVELRKLA